MKKNHNGLYTFQDKSKDSKKKHFATQEKKIFKAFRECPKTMKQVEVETGIDRANICRAVGKWKKANRIQVFRLGICPITKFDKVQFLTTNPELFRKSLTLNLFEQ